MLFRSIRVSAACDDFQITSRQIRAIRHIDFATDERHSIVRAHFCVLDQDGIRIGGFFDIGVTAILRKRKTIPCHKENSLAVRRLYILDAVKGNLAALDADIATGNKATAVTVTALLGVAWSPVL